MKLIYRSLVIENNYASFTRFSYMHCGFGFVGFFHVQLSSHLIIVCVCCVFHICVMLD